MPEANASAESDAVQDAQPEAVTLSESERVAISLAYGKSLAEPVPEPRSHEERIADALSQPDRNGIAFNRALAECLAKLFAEQIPVAIPKLVADAPSHTYGVSIGVPDGFSIPFTKRESVAAPESFSVPYKGSDSDSRADEERVPDPTPGADRIPDHEPEQITLALAGPVRDAASHAVAKAYRIGFTDGYAKRLADAAAERDRQSNAERATLYPAHPDDSADREPNASYHAVGTPSYYVSHPGAYADCSKPECVAQRFSKPRGHK